MSTLKAPSYAHAVANAKSPPRRSGSLTNLSRPSLETQLKELSHPQPQSFILTAVLQLLAPLDSPTDVFLMNRSYMQNWLAWANHENVPPTEKQRLQTGVRLAAEKLGLKPPSFHLKYTDPGPIDNSTLSIDGFSLLLKPNVVLRDGTQERVGMEDVFPRVQSLPNPSATSTPNNALSTQEDEEDIDVDGDDILCCAVPAKFYETLRSIIGVVCEDGYSVSFQSYQQDPFLSETEALIHHHSIHTETKTTIDSMANFGIEMVSQYPRPIEFRRKVIMIPKKKKFTMGRQDDSNPMTKLLIEEENRAEPLLIPTVEVHPVKLKYTVTNGSTNISAKKNSNSKEEAHDGFVLVSQQTSVYETLQALMKVAAPDTTSSCKRIWSRRDTNGTKSGDGFDLVDLHLLDGKLLRDNDKDEAPRSPRKSMGKWLEGHFADAGNTSLECDILVEVRRLNSTWSRESLELQNRIQVGDFVDAQDSTGKWYEAIVREVAEETVTVHYFGWASKWNGTMRRRKDSNVDARIAKLQAPAPLWSHSRRWRERITEGKVIEVRDASSRADRPKWYKGVVQRIGLRNRRMAIKTGGAELEMLEDPNNTGDKRALLLLNRKQQIMVEVEKENENANDDMRYDDMSMSAMSAWSAWTTDTLKPSPPFLRWVNLYGEEICEGGTHMKIRADGQVAVTLQYEVDPTRQPVEIMKSHNGMFGQGFMKESMLGTPPAPGSVGMHNLGNSCFINTIVQCLNHIEPLTSYYLNGDYITDLNTRNPLGSGGRVASAYASLLKEAWSGKYSALAPRLLKQTVASFAPQFNNSYQHDSQEFCQYLLDGLHEDCNRVVNKPYVEELEGFGMEDQKAAIETWRKHLLRHDSIIVDRCQGMHRSHLTCPKCGRESIKFDAFSTISVPLATDKMSASIELMDCIDKFLEGEQLDELNAWYCPGCKKHVCALKMIALWSVPDVLILHLKRFQFDHCSVRNDVIRSKLNETVRFPIERLDLTDKVLGPIDESAPPVYKLFGVSEHTGPTANSGHYTATVRNCKDGRWYRYNDAHVGETTAEVALTGGAYLLFYQRSQGSARWGGMEKVMQDKNITDQDGFTKVTGKKKKKKGY